MDCSLDIGTYYYSPAERARFFTGDLLREWSRVHADVLFDAHDLKFAGGPKLKQGKSWHEWKAAVLLHEVTGFHALVTRYQRPDAIRKQTLLRKLMNPAVWDLLMGKRRLGAAQGPDLIMFDPSDHSRWLFVETKKRREPFTAKQRFFFPMLADAAQRPVCMLTFAPAPTDETEDRWIGKPSPDVLQAAAAGSFSDVQPRGESAEARRPRAAASGRDLT